MGNFFGAAHPPSASGGSLLRRLMAGASPIIMGAALIGIGGPVAPAYAQSVNLGNTANRITPDGRTQTRVTINDNHTSIRTDTVSNGVGFNTFTDFQQAAGTRVDLFVPDQAGSLVNIVRNGIVIEGTLNAYKDGQIGGNVFFSSSNGFILGAQGQMNVGTLTVNTPTQAFLDRLMGANGTINMAVANQLMRGEVPISDNGRIAILGKVNADGNITLQGRSIHVSGRTGPLTGDDLSQRSKFGATVNSAGLVEGGAMVSRGGRISIVATGQTRIGGRIDASAARAGSVDVRAIDITVESGAQVSADGASGGEVIVFANGTLVVEDGAQFSASATAALGDGGFVELSGRNARIGAVRVDLSAQAGGKAGTLLIDPVDLWIGAGAPASADSTSPNIVSLGAAVILQADNSITLAGTIDTRMLTGVVSTGNSGSVTMQAPLITLLDGSVIRADVTLGSGFAAGDIILEATRTATLLGSGLAKIEIGQGGGTAPVLSGRDITLRASASVNQASLLLALPTARAQIRVNGGEIDATGTFSATATGVSNGGVTLLPLGIVVTNSEGSIVIGGNTRIDAGALTLAASSNVNSSILTESLAPAGSAADGAVAISTINSTASARIGGTARITVAGASNVTAQNNVTSKADATPIAAQFGASLAVSVVTAIASAQVGDAAQVASGSLTLDARTITDITLKAAAAQGGATAPSAGSKTKEYLDDPAYGQQASTSEGGVSVVGALVISDLTSTTRAGVDSTGTTTITGALAITTATQNGADLTADGSAVDSATGVGAAVGINIARVTNDATLARSVSAGSAALSAGMTGPGNVFATSTNSGAGASNVGVAGSFALNLIDAQSSARLSPGAAVAITGGAVSLSSENKTQATGSAKADATGGKVGVGASVALTIVANRSISEISDGVALTGAGDVTLAAAGDHTLSTEADAGSAGAISVTPALGLSLVTNTTSARIGTGAALTSGGAVSVSAQQAARTTTKASGKAAGADVAVGAALALALVDDRATATTARDITATGAVSFLAAGLSASTLNAVAGASGAAAEDDGSAPAGKPDVNQNATAQFKGGASKQKAAGVGSTDQQNATDTTADDEGGREASTSEGNISIAAAVGINVQKNLVQAIVPDAVTISAGGILTLRAATNTDGKITADGKAVGVADADGNKPPEANIGVGAAVAVNVVKGQGIARLGVANHSAGGAVIEATKLDVETLLAGGAATARPDAFEAITISGAGASNVGIAGSVALNLIDTGSEATLAAGTTLAISGGGAVRLASDAVMGATTSAKADATGGKVGVGASVALTIVANRSISEISDGVALTGAGDVTLAATGDHTLSTEADAGSAGAISVTPALGLSLVTNTTSARIGTGAALTSGGAVSVSAQQAARTTTKASGKAAGSNVAVGAALALALVDDRATATTARDVTATGAVSFLAAGLSASTLESEASAAGAKDANDADAAPTSSGDSVDKQATTEFKGGASKQKSSGVGSAGQQGATDTAANDEGGRSAKTSEGKVSVAASVAINVQNSQVSALVPDGVNIVSGGLLTVQSSAASHGVLSADGQAVKGDGGTSQVGIGVAVSVNVLNATSTARLGAGTHSGAGLSVGALRYAGEATDTVTATAKSGAGGSKVGIAGSVALNLVTITSRASVAGGASVALGAGASRIDATGAVLATAKAEPSDEAAVGGKVGVGASFAMNLITTTTEAVAENGATLTAGAGLAVAVTSDLSTITEASAGAAGGIAVDASVALALLNQNTTARIGTGNALSMGAGAVSVMATGTGTQAATSTGENKSGKVGVGASAAIILGNGASDGVLLNTSVTSATLARSITAAGSLAIAATSTRTYDAKASATAGGGVFSDSDEKKNDKTGGTSSSADSLDKTKDSQRDEKGNKGGSKVTIAAAAGIATAQDAVTAEIAAGLSVATSGAVTLSASNTSGVAASGSGVADNPQSKVGIGVGVGLGILNNKTTARVGNGSSVTAGSVSVTANSRENADGPYLRRLTALGVSGASGSSVAVAGSLAVGISTGRTNALLGDNVTVNSGGAVALGVDNTSQLSAKALAGAVSTGSGAGVGASIAVVVSEKEYGAGMGANANITAGSLSVTALNRRIDAGNVLAFASFDDWDALSASLTAAVDNKILGDSNYYVEAIGGAASSGVAVQGSFGVMVFGDTLAAGIGANSNVNAGTGTVTLLADGDFFAQDLSGALSVSTSSAAVGVSGSVIVSSGVTTATLGDGARITAAGAFNSRAQARQDIWVLSASAAAASSAGVAGVATVITSNNRVEALIGLGARVTVSGAGAVALNAKNDFETFSLAAGLGAGGTAGIGAAASVVTVNNTTRAALADGTSTANRAEINTNGAITVAANATATGKTYTAAGGAAGTVGVGAGAGVYVLATTTEARVGNFAKVGNLATGGDITVSASDVSTLLTVAGAAGIGGTVGAGAGVAIGVIGKTTSASIGAQANVRGGNVAVTATSEEEFDALTAAVAVGGKAGIAGAVTVLSVTTNTTARIGAGAVVLADGNVAVTADGKTEIDMIEGAFGGGSVAVGASVGVTVINATTLARIDDGADVTALGNRAARTITLGHTPVLTNYGAGEGFKAADFDASDANVVTGADAQAARDAGLALLTRKRGATKQTGSARGVIVNAADMTAVRSLTVAGSVGAVGIALSAGVPVITTDTRAQIGANALINKGAGAANIAQDISVVAASDMYTLGFSGAVAAGGVGIGAGVNVAVLSTTTEASVGTGANMEAEGDVLVSADSTQDLVGIGAAGAAAGSVALAGGVSVLDLTTVTTARLGGTTVAQGNAEVLAQDQTRTAMLAGAVAVGASAGIGAAVSVVNLNKDVTASVASGASVSALGLHGTQDIYTGSDFNARRTTARGLNVQADSSQQAFTLALAGAAGGVGLSGVVALSLFDVTTQAFIGNNANINSVGGANAAQDVAVTARDTTATAVIAGSVAVGAVGISGALDVGIFKNTTAGFIGDNVTLNAQRDLFVNGLSNRAGNSFVLGAGGGLVGLAAGIAVYNYGDGIAPGGAADQEIGDASSSGSLSLTALTGDAQSQARNGEVNGLLAESDDENVRDISAAAQARRNLVDIQGAVTSTLVVPAGTSASIGGGTMTVVGTAHVNSSDALNVKMTTGAVAGGGLAAGAGIGILTIDAGSTAQIDGTGAMNVGGLDLRARTNRTINSLQFAGSAGLLAAVSADVGIITDRSRTLAAVRGRAVNTTGVVAINAASVRMIDLEAKGGGISGGVAVGASVGRAELGGSVRAEVINGATIGQSGARAASITVGASANDTVTVDALAAGGGIGAALQGAAAAARITTAVATLVNNAQMYAANLANITAMATGRAEARATGFAMAGFLAAGGSLGDAKMNGSATVTIANNARIDAGSISITAMLLAPLVTSYSSGSAGALVGVNATVSRAETTGTAVSNVSGSRLISTGNTTVGATSTTTQKAEASGLAVGIVAAGLNDARAQSTTTTRATLTDMAQVSAGGLFINATGTDSNMAETTAGSGGVIAGASARSDTFSRGTVQAGVLTTVAPATLDIAGLVQIEAAQNTTFGGFVDSRQASLAGFSGANLHHFVENTVDADVGNRVTINARDFEMRARNLVNNPVRAGGGRNVDSVSAGLADVPSGGASVSVTQNTNANIGVDAVVNLTRPVFGVGLGLLQIEAYNNSILNQRVNLDSGGLIAVASAEISAVVTANAGVTLGNRARLEVERGDIDIAAWGEGTADLRASATTYGFAGAPSGEANLIYTGTNTYLQGANALVQASDGITPLDGSVPSNATVRISAGRGLNGARQTLDLNATVDLFNKTAIPIPSGPNPIVIVNSTGNVTIGASNPTITREGVRAAGDITIVADRGTINATARGTGKDIYREVLAEIASAISNAFGGGDVSFDYNGGTTQTNGGTARVWVDGRVETGIQRTKQITISAAACEDNAALCVNNPALGNILITGSATAPVGTEILVRVAELRRLISDYEQDPIAKAAFQNEIGFLQRKLAALGLGTFNAAGTFVPGAFAGPSQRDSLLASAEGVAVQISTAQGALITNSVAGITGELSDFALFVNSAYTRATFGISAAFDTTVAQVRGISTFNAAVNNPQIVAATTARNQGLAAAQLVSSTEAATLVLRDQNIVKVAEIAAAQAVLSNALIAGNAGQIAAQNTIIANATNTIRTNLNTIASNVTTIRTQGEIARDRALTARNTLDALVNLPNEAVAGTAAQKAAINARNNSNNAIRAGLLAPLVTDGTTGAIISSGALTALRELQGVVTVELANNAPTLTSISNTASGAAGTAGSVQTTVNQITNLTGTFATTTQQAAAAPTSSGSPTSVTLTLADAAARLGNVSVEASVLGGSGSGQLLAPGDARILVTNNTSNTIKLGNMLIPDYDAGNLRLNGVLVNSVADITRLNAGGVAASFSEVVTSLTSSRGLVEVVSTYNPEGLPLGVAPKIAPDIILDTGKVIDNLGGAVNIRSEAGNIYIRGAINAGSVDILAKNGDFVASFVNGFNHIGGDPASFNRPDLPGERGKGITANGAISISARFLNINSRIQSGIANWNLTLANGDLLTAAPEAIGLTAGAITTAIAASQSTITNSAGQTININTTPPGIDPDELERVTDQYKAEIVLNPEVDPVRTLTIDGVLTQVNIKDYLSGSPTYRLEFNRGVAEAYVAATPAAEGSFTVINAASDNIGALYDAKTGQFVVNGTSVKGGYIQIFGQIMNTSTSGGQLNVLDGFGTINITNATSIPVILRNLSTGEDTTVVRDPVTGEENRVILRGTSGVIELTDVIGVNASSPSNPIVSVRRTTYTRDYVPGQAAGTVQILTQTGTIRNSDGTLILNAGATTTGADRTASYTPSTLSGTQRYVWTEGEEYRRVSKYTKTSSDVFNAVTTSTITQLTAVGAPLLTSEYRLADGTYVTTQNTLRFGALDIVRGAAFQSPASTSVANSTLDNVVLTTASNSIFKPDNGTSIGLILTYTSSRSCTWYTLCISGEKTRNYELRQEYTTFITQSLKANNPIAVNFIGSNTGAINVTSNNADVVMINTLNSRAGSVTINVGATSSIIQGDLAASIRARQITLSAGRNVGGITNPHNSGAPVNPAIAVNLTGTERPGAFVSAQATNGNVSLIARGDLVVDQVTAGGNVTAGRGRVDVVSFGGIDGIDQNALVQAQRVTLTALGGGIGQTGDTGMLRVNTGYTADPLQRPFGDPDIAPRNPAFDQANVLFGLSATATGDIGIRAGNWGSNADGTMLVVQALSSGGDVRLRSTGQILDNNPSQTIDQRTYDELLGFWESLGLLEDDASRGVDGSVNAAKQANMIVSFENSVTQSYGQYWSVRRTQADGGASFDASFEYTLSPDAAQLAGLRATYRAEALAADPAADADAIAARRVAQFEAETTARRTTMLDFFRDEALADGAADPAAVAQTKLREFEERQTTEYRALNDKVGGLTTGFTDGFRYGATDAEKAGLVKGSVWTERELAFALAPGALKTVTGTNPVIKDPNVAGRSVTIEADRGIGETIIDPTTGLRGVSILSSTDPRNLTLDQRVALAAAERSDLLLTVGPVRLPANATAEQIAAFDTASALGLDVVGVSTSLELGAPRSSFSARQKAALTAAANGLVAPENTLLTILSARPLNFNAATALTIDVPNVSDATNRDIGAVFVASRGNAALGNITTFGETRIKVQGDITNAPVSNVVTGTLILEAARGGIGTLALPLNIAPRPGVATTARAQNGVFLNFAGNGVIDTVYSPQNVALRATGSLLNANDDALINVLGAQVSLNAGAAIGTVARALNVAAGLGGAITAVAANDINLFGPLNFRFVIGRADAGGTIRLTGAVDTVIDGLAETPGDVVLSAGGTLSVTGQGDVHSIAGQISGNASAIRMLTGATMRADAGRIILDALLGNAQVTGLVSGSGNAAAVSITAAGRILAGNADPRTDIMAMAAGAGVFLSGALGVGDQTQANAILDDSTVTDVANALRIRTNAIAATSAQGDLNLAGLGDAVFSSLTAPLGTITGTAEGTLVVTTASSGGTQAFTAPGAVTFGTLTTAGLLPADPGDVSVTSTASTVSGTSIDAAGTIRLIGTNVTFTTLKSGVDIVADASTGATTGGTVEAGRDAAITGVGVALDTVKTVRDSSIDGKTGAVTITRIDAGGTSSILGAGVIFDTIIAGVDSLITSTGDIIGELEEAGDRIVNIAGFGPGNTGILDVKIMRARLLDLQSTGALTVGKIEVGEFLTLRADDITALDVTQVPAGPRMLSVTLTGANDTVATRARLNVDAPFGLVMPSVKVSETTLNTTANFVDVQSAEIPLQGASTMQGTKVLSTPSQVLFVDNRSQTPKGSPPSNLQVFEPTRPFAATLNGTAVRTDSYVVVYDPTVQVTNQLGLPYDGISLVRDTVRNIRQSGAPIFLLQGAIPLPGDAQPDDEDELEISDLNDTIVEINGVEYNVYVRGAGPAVLLSR